MSALAELVDRGLMAPDWGEALAPDDDQIGAILDRLRADGAYLPAEDLIFRAFEQPLAAVKVLIVGQDPYPTPGHPVGLSFSVSPDVRPLPRSLINIYTELSADLGISPATHGDLSRWAEQGVMLLNRVLTVRPGSADSHRGYGWQKVTDEAIRAYAARGGPRAAILWGNKAQSLKGLLGDVPCVESSHPSPLSARHSFFGSKPFSRVNQLLAEQGGVAVDWNIVDD